MKQLNKLKWDLIVINALLVGVIVFISALGTGTNLTIVLPAAILSGVLRFLVELQGEVKEEIKNVKRKCKEKNHALSGVFFF